MQILTPEDFRDFLWSFDSGRGVANEALCIRDRMRWCREKGLAGRYFANARLDRMFKVDAVEMTTKEEDSRHIVITIRLMQVKSSRPSEEAVREIQAAHKDFRALFEAEAHAAREATGAGKRVRYEYYSLVAFDRGQGMMDYSNELLLGTREFEGSRAN